MTEREAERAAIVASLRADAERCDCAARSDNECTCGAWDGFKRVYVTDIADAIERGDHSKA